LGRKPLRIYVGNQDELFYLLVTEQFGAGGERPTRNRACDWRRGAQFYA
jgi:hypothetical protein